MTSHYFIFVFLSLLPSMIWLVFFLQEDRKPEPVRMILKIFFLGALITAPALLVTYLVYSGLLKIGLSEFALNMIMVVIVAAVTEELAKFFVVKKSVLKSPECDEPVDIMIYAITAALGFAAVENAFFLVPEGFPLPRAAMDVMIIDSYLRLVSATFLHALIAGIMGYFIALSVLYAQKRTRLLLTGIFLAIFLHGFYNFIIMYSLEIKKEAVIAAPILLIILFIAVCLCFKKLKKTASICKL